MTVSDEHYPAEYREGSVIFFGKKFVVGPDVLIPRLETESLVRYARKRIREKEIRILADIGTGSGVIAISCADLIDLVYCIDLSQAALRIARKNMTSLFPQKESIFLDGNLLNPLARHARLGGPIYITANLPYIRAEDWENMSPDTRYEPKMALFGGENTGFELYEELFRQLDEWKYPYDRYLCIEFGYDQRSIAQEVLGLYPWQVEFFPDHAGIERFAEIYIPAK